MYVQNSKQARWLYYIFFSPSFSYFSLNLQHPLLVLWEAGQVLAAVSQDKKNTVSLLIETFKVCSSYIRVYLLKVTVIFFMRKLCLDTRNPKLKLSINYSAIVKLTAKSIYLLHEVHDVFKCAFFFWFLFLHLKVPTYFRHDLGLLFITLVVVWTKAGLVGFQPFRILWGWVMFTIDTQKQSQRRVSKHIQTLEVISFRDG